MGTLALASGLAGCAVPKLPVTSSRAARGDTSALNVQEGALSQAAPLLQPSGADVAFEIVAREVEWELAPGKVIRAMTYGGAVPGSVIRVREGQRMRITLRNQLHEPTTIHWHGVDVPVGMDGVPGISQPEVQPGASFMYEFEARPAGTRWYHTHVNSVVQLDAGLSAPFIIEPLAPEPAVDRDYTLVLDDFIANGTADRPSEPLSDMMGGMMSGSDMGGMMGGSSMSGMMGNPRVDETYDTFTINGKAFPATENLVVRKGDRVRLRLINASNMQTFVIRLLGHKLQVTHTDGNPLRAPVAVDALPIAPSERYDVIVTADNPGKWLLYTMDRHHTDNGLATYVVYQGSESAPVNEDGARKVVVWRYGMGEGVDILPRDNEARVVRDLTLAGGGMMGTAEDEWTINGLRYPDTDRIPARRNDRVRLSVTNMSAESHPMHLHGQSFRVLRMNGATLRAPLIKDSLDVSAHMGAAEIEFIAHNPGDWMFHCHKPMHMDGGMISLVQIA
jgi:FtsP/CotA-like multicopper oxidase with cupredoxin domain